MAKSRGFWSSVDEKVQEQKEATSSVGPAETFAASMVAGLIVAAFLWWWRGLEFALVIVVITVVHSAFRAFRRAREIRAEAELSENSRKKRAAKARRKR